MTETQKVLFPTDLSKHAKETFGLACSIARDRKAKLIVLHVIPAGPLITPINSLASEQARHTEEDLKSYKREMTEKMASLLSLSDWPLVEHLLKEGDPATAIGHTAHELGCDLIVMETHGKSEAERQVLGSVVADVVHHSPCPVFMLRFPSNSRNS